MRAHPALLAAAAAALIVGVGTPRAAAAGEPRRARSVGLLLRAGLDFGGDQLVKIEWTNGDEKTFRAGELATVSGGVILHPEDAPWAVEATAGYKFDRARGTNGDVAFTRIPVDLVASWTARGHRLGAGGTVHLDPTLACDAAPVCDFTRHYDTAFGAIAQYAYGLRLGRNAGLDLGVRYTWIRYAAPDAPTRDGSGFGLFLGGRL